MGSNLCVLKGILEMRNMGVYGSAFDKKNAIGLGGFTGTELTCTSVQNNGYVGCLSGEQDEMEFNIFFMKEPDYNIIVMSNFSYLTVPQVQKGGNNHVG